MGNITEKEFLAANARGARLKNKTATVEKVFYDRGSKKVRIVMLSGLEMSFNPESVQGLEKATPDDLTDIQLSPSGLGFHLPSIDADVYIPSLLEGLLGSKKWIAARMGKAGGSATTENKAAAARANGKLGGRPKKIRELAHS